MLLCQNDRHRNPVSLIQYPEVVLVVGYIMLGTLAAFGLVSALWVLYGFLLPAERGGGLYAPARPGVTEDSFARRYLWLRELGLLREEGISAYLVDAHNRVQVIDQRTVIKRETQYGKYVSLLPFMGAVEGITLKGMKYPLEDYILDHCHSIGISNEITGEQAEIEFRTGRLIVIESKD